MLILFWAYVLCLLHTPHTLLIHPIIIIFFCYLFIIIIFILKRENENILNYKKLQKKIEKNLKTKNVLFCFVVFVRSPAPCDTHFQKYQK